jgi:hypothetical protein
MNSTIKETWSQTHPAVKSAVVVVGVALAGFVLYKIYKTVVGAIGKVTNRKEGGEALQELIELQAQGITPTISDSTAEGMINAIRTECNTSWYEDTSEQTIYTQLQKVRNLADWAKLKYRWGTQNIKGIPVSLTQALVGELDDYEKTQANSILFLAGVTNAL